MIRAYGCPEIGGQFESIFVWPELSDALSGLRESWMEDEENDTDIILVNEAGHVEAVLARHIDDPEVCLTTYTNGDREQHRCHYVIDFEGRYQRTEVTQLNAAQKEANWKRN